MRILHKLCTVALSAAVVWFAPGPVTQSAVAAEFLMFEGDMVRGRPQEGATGPTCVLTSQFKRKEHVVWRLRVFDPKTGEQLDKDGLTSLVVELPDGGRYQAHFGTHPRRNPTDSFWSVSWAIPADYPTGALTYKVVATDLDGKKHTWVPFKVGLSQLAVIEGDVKFAK